MIVGFLNNQIDNRGTGNAIFDYAHYNEVILGNESRILTLDTAARSKLMVRRLLDRFEKIYQPDETKCDVIYHIKYGNDDGWRPTASKLGRTRYVVHAVFDGSQPHGNRYAVISEWMSKRDKQPFVPHIVNLPDIKNANYREVWDIPEDAVVFGRSGGYDTFDIPWVWDAIARANPERYFLFLNTAKPEYTLGNNVRWIGETSNAVFKTTFINTCDYMLHARQRGETFGISVGEFAIKGKPVLTYSESPEQAHIFELNKAALGYYPYKNQEELEFLLNGFDVGWPIYAYTEFTPELVMRKFKDVFLD